MTTEELKRYLDEEAADNYPVVTDIAGASGKWKRLKKYKQGQLTCRDFEKSGAPGKVVTVVTDEEDEAVVEVHLQGQTPTYYYSIDTDPDMLEEAECLDATGNCIPAEAVLGIGSQSQYMDDGRYGAQIALEPLFQSTLGRKAYEDMEGTFFLGPGEAAKLEPILIKQGWKKGQW